MNIVNTLAKSLALYHQGYKEHAELLLGMLSAEYGPAIWERKLYVYVVGVVLG